MFPTFDILEEVKRIDNFYSSQVRLGEIMKWQLNLPYTSSFFFFFGEESHMS